MSFHYLTVMGRDFENEKKLTPIQILNITSVNSQNIVNNIGIFNDSATMNSIVNE